MGTRSWFRVHSFTGVVTGLMLFIVCWSGTMAVVSHEIDWLVTPALRVEPGEAWAGWPAWLAAVREAHPEASVSRLEAPRYRRSAAVAVVERADGALRRIYVNPYTAEVLGEGSFYTVQRFFRNLHMSLFFGGPGIYLVTVFAIALLVALAAVLVFYKRWWRRFATLPRGRGRAFWSRLHSTAGLWSMWFLLLMAVTGLWYLFEMVRLDFLDGKFSYAGIGPTAVVQVPAPRSDPAQAALSYAALLERFRAARPGFEIRTLGVNRSHPGALYIDGQAGHLLVRDRANQFHIDTHSGRVLLAQDAGDYPLYWRWSDTADPLHFGDFGGLWSKGIWFLFGLVLSGLVLSGSWLHCHRLLRGAAERAHHRWPGTMLAVLLTLVLLAVAVQAGFEQAAAAYGPRVDGVKRLPALAPGVEAVIVAWSGVTLAIIAAWVGMLWHAGRRREWIEGAGSPLVQASRRR